MSEIEVGTKVFALNMRIYDDGCSTLDKRFWSNGTIVKKYAYEAKVLRRNVTLVDIDFGTHVDVGVELDENLMHKS